jgi:predicted kinase
MSTDIQFDHPVVIFVRGVPGSGKSHLTDALQEALPRDRVVILDPDATDYDSEAYAQHVATMKAEGTDEKLFPYRFLRAQAYDAIASNKVVVWNQPFSNIDMFHRIVGRMHEQAENVGTKLSILIIEVEVPAETAKARIADRKANGGHGPSDTTFERFLSDHKSLADTDYNTVAVRGDDDVQKSVSIVLKTLREIAQG